jgi:hypothetical protein
MGATYKLVAVLRASDKKLLRWGYTPFVVAAGEELLQVPDTPQARAMPSTMDGDPAAYWHAASGTWEAVNEP